MRKFKKWSQHYKILKWAFETRQWFVPEDFMQYNTQQFVWYEANARISELYKKWYLQKCKWSDKKAMLNNSHKKRALYRVNTDKEVMQSIKEIYQANEVSW